MFGITSAIFCFWCKRNCQLLHLYCSFLRIIMFRSTHIDLIITYQIHFDFHFPNVLGYAVFPTAPRLFLHPSPSPSYILQSSDICPLFIQTIVCSITPQQNTSHFYFSLLNYIVTKNWQFVDAQPMRPLITNTSQYQ